MTSFDELVVRITGASWMAGDIADVDEALFREF